MFLLILQLYKKIYLFLTKKKEAKNIGRKFQMYVNVVTLMGTPARGHPSPVKPPRPHQFSGIVMPLLMSTK
jgi:hypothetical protein